MLVEMADAGLATSETSDITYHAAAICIGMQFSCTETENFKKLEARCNYSVEVLIILQCHAFSGIYCNWTLTQI